MSYNSVFEYYGSVELISRFNDWCDKNHYYDDRIYYNDRESFNLLAGDSDPWEVAVMMKHNNGWEISDGYLAVRNGNPFSFTNLKEYLADFPEFLSEMEADMEEEEE